jgi:peptidylprolyl isomerase
VCFDQTPWLDGKHTVFGKIVEGGSVLDALEKVGSDNGMPKEPVEVTDCGEVKQQ